LGKKGGGGDFVCHKQKEIVLYQFLSFIFLFSNKIFECKQKKGVHLQPEKIIYKQTKY